MALTIQEQLLMVFCKQTKLRYTKLTEEEKQWLTGIVQKSELAKSYVPQRVRESNKYTFERNKANN